MDRQAQDCAVGAGMIATQTSPDDYYWLDKLLVPKDHHQDCPDECWRYESDCGCALCQWWEQEMTEPIHSEPEWWAHHYGKD